MSSPRQPDARSVAARWDLACLSPHFDDAALSAGGWLHRRAAAGARTLVITVCAAPPPAGALSPFAAAHHRRWGAAAGQEGIAAERMTRHRRAEDEAALAALGVAGRWLDVPDAIYRRLPETGGEGHAAPHAPDKRMAPSPPTRSRWLYTDLESLFGPLDERERPAIDALARSLAALPGITDETELLVPLGVGGHVDHRLVRAAAERWRGRNLAYYEDWPYARDDDALDEAVAGTDLEPELVPLELEDVEAKIRAIAAYGSQISTFWPSSDVMAQEVRASARRRGSPAGKPGSSAVRAETPLRLAGGPGAAGAERIWRLSRPAPAA